MRLSNIRKELRKLIQEYLQVIYNELIARGIEHESSLLKTKHDHVKIINKARKKMNLKKNNILKKFKNENYDRYFIDMFIRSYGQYLCQKMNKKGRKINFIIDVVLLAVIFVLILILLVNRYIIVLFERLKREQQLNTVFIYYYEWRRNFLPQKYKKDKVLFLKKSTKSLNFKDIILILKIIKFSGIVYLVNDPKFILGLIKWLSIYSDIIYRYRPKNIVNFFEGSFSSSLVTWYCNYHNVKHVNLMHGERFFNSSQAFSSFNKFYVWGNYFERLFKLLHCRADKFIQEPNSLHIAAYKLRDKASKKKQRTVSFIYDGYMNLKNYVKLIHKLSDCIDYNWVIRIRPHYFLSQKQNDLFIKNMMKIFGDHKIVMDDFKSTDILQTIKKSELVVSCASTALLDSWIAGRKIIILYDETMVNYPIEKFCDSKNVLVLDENFNNIIFHRFLHNELCEKREIDILKKVIKIDAKNSERNFSKI